MAVGFPAGITSAFVINNAQTRLATLRDALNAVHDFKLWLSAYAATDLEAAPISMDAASATALMSAFADADALYQIFNTGLPPGTYPQPASSYVYGSSQRVIIGPLS